MVVPSTKAQNSAQVECLCFVDLWGIEPHTRACHARVLPLYYRPAWALLYSKIVSAGKSVAFVSNRLLCSGIGPLAHLVEHLICNEGVAGSSPVGSTVADKGDRITSFALKTLAICLVPKMLPLKVTPEGN